MALTAPRVHNGMIATLEDVLEFYDRGRSENPNVAYRRRRDRDDAVDVPGRLDRRFRGVDDMSDEEMRDIIAFLHSLTDADFDRTIPSRLPSGLEPGGAIAGRDVDGRGG